MRNIDSYHRKGSVYVYVLSVALLITGIGLSSLWAMRMERRIAGVGEAVVQVRIAAGSFLEVALLRIANNPSWRSAYTHDVWIADENVENVSCTFKLVDEQDADLANDDTQPVRLYAKATVGDAVRIYSVLLQGNFLDRRVAQGSDDAEERSDTGETFLNHKLDIPVDPGANQSDIVGIRFQNVTIPNSTLITDAWIQFEADDSDSGAASFTIRCQATDDTASFTSMAYDISSRPTTTAFASFVPAAWSNNQAGPNERTADIASVIQEIVDRPGWNSGNAMTFIFTGSGRRRAKSYDKDPGTAPLLHVESAPSMTPVPGSWRREVLP